VRVGALGLLPPEGQVRLLGVIVSSASMEACFISSGSVILTTTRSRRNSASCVCSLSPSSILVAGASLFSLGSVLRSDSLPGSLLRGPTHGVEQVAYVYSKVVSEGAVESEVTHSKPVLSARDLVRWGIATKAIAGGTLTTMALSILGLYIIQDRLVYWPSSLNKGNPGRFGMDFEDVNVVTSDNVAISGWFIKNAQDTSRVPTVIYFHGTDKNASFRLRKAAELYRAVECNILLISYRGYGESMGRPSEKGMCTDADTNMTYIRSRTDVDQKNIWVYGESLGGAVALYFTEKFEGDVRGLILENTFTSLIDMIKYVHPLLVSIAETARG